MLSQILFFCFILLLSGNLLCAQAWKGEVNPDLPALEARAEEGDPAAMAEFAFHSMRCMGGLEYQPKRIFDYFTRSAEAGNVDGTVGLAHCFAFNVGTVRDLRRAEKLIREPFAQGHPVAQKIMGYFYYGKQGIRPLNLAKVSELYQKSAAQGCIGAKYNVIIGYIKGNPELDVERGMNELRAMHEERIFPMASAYLLQSLGKHRIWEDHDEVFKSCVQRLSEYGDLNEPYCLYKLGGFHHDAGDLENAVACYAQSAHLGRAHAYFQLWRLVKYGEQKDFGTVWTQNRHRGNLALHAYLRGAWNRASLSDASWEITRMGSWNSEYQKHFPQLEKDCISALKDGGCNMHDALGRIYRRAKAKDNPQLVKPEWARAHLLAHTHHSSANAPGELAYLYFEDKTPENLARGYACAKRAIKMGHSSWRTPKRNEWLEKQMTPETKERALELMAEDFPMGKKYRREAEELLIQIGHLDELSEDLRD